jgi:hypothetical protein
MGSLVLQLPTEWKAALISPASCGQAGDAFQHNVRNTLSKDVLDFVGAGAFWAAATARSRRQPG